MDDNDDNPPEKNYPLSPARMSKTPSWIMLGFVLGALCVLAFPKRTPKPAAAPSPPVVAVAAAPSEPREPPPLSRIETLFEIWGQHAVWADDRTEVAMWDTKEERFADFYEVRKMDGKLYFRSIPALTRRVIARGKPMPESPLQFTETEEQYQEWREYGRRENPMKAMWEPPRQPATSLPPPTIRPADASVRVPAAPPVESLPKMAPGGGK